MRIKNLKFKKCNFIFLNRFLGTIIPCTRMQWIETQVLGNKYILKPALWPFIYLDWNFSISIYCTVYPSWIRINICLKACIMVHLFPSNLGFNACIPVQGNTVKTFEKCRIDILYLYTNELCTFFIYWVFRSKKWYK